MTTAVSSRPRRNFFNGNKLGKLGFGPLGRPRASPRTSKGSHGTPKPPKWSTRVPQSLQNGAQTTPKASKKRSQATPRAPKMQPGRGAPVTGAQFRLARLPQNLRQEKSRMAVNRTGTAVNGPVFYRILLRFLTVGAGPHPQP